MIRRSTILLCSLLFFCMTFFVMAQNNAKTSFERARMLQDRQDWYGASESYQEALQYNPDYGEAWLGLAQCTYETGEYSLTITYLEKAAQRYKDREILLHLAELYHAQGQTSKAMAILRPMLQAAPNDATLDAFMERLHLHF